MGSVQRYREIVDRVLREHASYTPSVGTIETKRIVDREQDEYVLMSAGWGPHGRVHSVLGHLRLHDGKVWIEHDGTEKGFAVELVEAGIPKDDIVLGFYRPERRKRTEFAVA